MTTVAIEPSQEQVPAQPTPGWLNERRLDLLIWSFVALGVGLRLLRYLLRFPLWGDECFVALNFLDRDFLGLVGPLEYNQICPLWFMWIEMALVKTLGFHEWSLRLFPTVCSVASVFLFRQLAMRLLRGVPLLLAVGIFCVSYYPIRHGAELKPYSADLLVALVILALCVRWLQSGQPRYGWWLAAFMPLGLGLSHPAVFVAIAASAAVLWSLWSKHIVGGWKPWWSMNVAAAGTFLAFYFLIIAQQSQAADAGGIHHYWIRSFPPLAAPWRIPAWLLDMHTGQMFAYPVGGPRGTSAATTLLCAVGAVLVWRKFHRWLAIVLIGPAVVGLAAAFAHAYPYGDSARIMQYIAPAICLLMAVGLAGLLTHRRLVVFLPRNLALALGALLVIGASSAVRDLTKPYKTEFDALNQAFARWIWHDLATDGEVACVQADLGVPLFPAEFWRTSALEYRCYQRIFSPRHRHGPRPPAWEKITEQHPLWCVAYGHKGTEPDPYALRDWLERMSADYELAGRVRLPLGSGGGVVFEQWYEIFQFVPKGHVGTAKRPASTVNAPQTH